VRIPFLQTAVAATIVLASPGGAFGHALPRAISDRPDDVGGPQIHVIYMLPRDGVDRALDTSGTLEASVTAWNAWFAEQSGGKQFRLDTSAGALDVSFVVATQTDAQIAAAGGFVREQLSQGIKAAGFNNQNKLYAVYYDGTSSVSCGSAAYPPLINDNVGAMYLHGLPQGPIPCDTNRFVPNGRPGYLEFAMLHEMLHTLGFVAGCAPHQWRQGHVNDATNDLMWAGDQPWVLPPVLDVGHDDYWLTGSTTCADLSRSPYVIGAPPPAAPTGLTAMPSSATAVALSWSAAPGATSYTIERDGQAFASATGLSYVATGLACSKTYMFGVRAVGPTGSSGATTAAGQTRVCAPGGATASTVSKTSIALEWSTVENAATYRITLSNGLSLDTDRTNAVFDQLDCGTSYTFTIVAIGPGGASAPSTASGTTAPCVPGTPTGLRVGRRTVTTIALAWKASSDATAYEVGVGGVRRARPRSTSVVIGRLKCSRRYTFRVVAVGPGGKSSPATVLGRTSRCAARRAHG
jgi:hypothetical protein